MPAHRHYDRSCVAVQVETALTAIAPVLEALQTAPHVLRARAELSIAMEAMQAEEDGEVVNEGQIDAESMFPCARGIGLFLLQSAMNHACAEAANTLVTTTDATWRAEVVVVAKRDIEAGSELTFDYLQRSDSEGASLDSRLDSVLERRATLRKQYQFECVCSACTFITI
jgi:hypothetical protein